MVAWEAWLPVAESVAIWDRDIDRQPRDARAALGVVPQEIVADVLQRSDPAVTVYVIDVDGEVAGIIQCCEESDEDYRSAGIDISLAPSWHGTGVAVDAMRTLAQHLFGQGHHRLTIDPAAHNARAIAAYAKVGFRRVGVMRQYERGVDGTWHDGLLMDLLADDLR